MGLSVSTEFTEEELKEYQELTYLNQNEILRCYETFVNLDPERTEEGRSIVHPMTTMFKVPELQANPFKDRICKVFSTKTDGSISFEDFLDMMSTFSEAAPNDLIYRRRFFETFDKHGLLLSHILANPWRGTERAPRRVKIEYAFRIYDFNGDDYICQNDMAKMIRRIAGRQRFNQETLRTIIDKVMEEADLDNNKMLSFAEFEHIIFKCPEFMRTFRIRL